MTNGQPLLQPSLCGSQERIVEHGSQRCAWFGSVDEVVVDTPPVHITYDRCEPADVEVWEVACVCSAHEMVIEPFQSLLHREGEVVFTVAVEVVAELSAHDVGRCRAKRLRHFVPSERIGGSGARPDHPW